MPRPARGRVVGRVGHRAARATERAPAVVASPGRLSSFARTMIRRPRPAGFPSGSVRTLRLPLRALQSLLKWTLAGREPRLCATANGLVGGGISPRLHENNDGFLLNPWYIGVPRSPERGTAPTALAADHQSPGSRDSSSGHSGYGGAAARGLEAREVTSLTGKETPLQEYFTPHGCRS